MMKKMLPEPPRLAGKLLSWLHPEDTLEEVEGDLAELYEYWIGRYGKTSAHLRYWWSALTVLPPFVKKRKNEKDYYTPSNMHPDMIRNYFKVAARNLLRNKSYSAINIGGLSVGIAVAIMIGLWISDELSFNRYHKHYDRIARVMQSATVNGDFGAGEHMPVPLADVLKEDFREDFRHVILSSWTHEHILAHGEKKFTRKGNFMSPDAPEMLTLKMIRGSREGLKDISAVLLSESASEALFGEENPLGKMVKIDNKLSVKVTGVYEDLPFNTYFHEMAFVAPWDLYLSSEPWIKNNAGWDNNSWQILAQLSPNSDFDVVSGKIKDLRLIHLPETAYMKPEIFLHPMSRWHLYGTWDKSGNPGGRIQFVWLFGIIGVFVLLLASINFMNLSTARSEKRAKEVGIRKAVGSLRSQLISQFFSESLLMTGIALVLSFILVLAMLPFFNEVADKQLVFPWKEPLFWLSGLSVSIVTGLISGSYPAIYLSSFQAVRVLKGTFRAGRFASVPRKALVVIQFTVSVTLIVGTFVVFRQIQHAKNRPVGYERNGLVTVSMNTPELFGVYNPLRRALLQTGAVAEMSTSSSPATALSSRQIGFEWEGKDPAFRAQFGVVAISHDFGKTVGWQFIEGRDFSRSFSTDSSGLVLNETAIKYMGLEDPVGKIIKWNGRPYRVLGVIRDMVMSSPFDPVYQTVFIMDYNWAGVINLKLNPGMSSAESFPKIEAVFRRFNPGSPFEYKFTDQQYALKFVAEERIGKLASLFTVLAVFISCLGLFGLASFIAEQRTKEIGVRKILGASVVNLLMLMSADFLLLVLIAFAIAVPLSWYFLDGWLHKYEYRTEVSWWIFLVSGAGALVLTLLTVSFQSIRAATMDPVKSLRSE